MHANPSPMPLYRDYGSWICQLLSGQSVQKIPIDAGFTCPNRDGHSGRGGCIFCSNSAYSPPYCTPSLSVAKQIELGKKFFSRKHREKPYYLSYFQSFTSSYSSISHLQKLYEEALQQPDIHGLVIGTRPDCINQELLSYLERLSNHTFVMLEFGIESCLDQTLLRINRGHDFETTKRAFSMAAEYHLHTGGHFIIGLPGETSTDVLNQATTLSELPVEALKIHQLQVIRSTPLGTEYQLSDEPAQLCCYHYSLDEYIPLLAQFISRLRPSIALDRFVSQSPSDLLLAPRWGIKPQAFKEMLDKYMIEQHLYQGLFWQGN